MSFTSTNNSHDSLTETIYFQHKNLCNLPNYFVISGQSMGPDGYGGECLGCGNQEHFVNCADIAIGSKPVNPLPLLPESVTPAPPPATNVITGPAYHVPNAPQVANTNNFEVNMASLVKQIYNSLATASVQTVPTTTPPAWPGTSFSNPPIEAQQWNSAPPQPQPNIQNMWQQNTMPSMMEASFGWPSGGATPTMNYPGYENGEYPEIGEHHAHSPGAGNNYIKGYNDAFTQMQDAFGFPGMSAKASPAFNEVSLALREAQKGSMGSSYSAPMMTAGNGCSDGSEMECRASNQMFGVEFDSFCQNACSMGQCQGQPQMCTCSCPSGSWSQSSQAYNAGAGSYCRAVDRAKAGSMDKWCVLNCRQNNCPSNLCVCG